MVNISVVRVAIIGTGCWTSRQVVALGIGSITMLSWHRATVANLIDISDSPHIDFPTLPASQKALLFAATHLLLSLKHTGLRSLQANILRQSYAWWPRSRRFCYCKAAVACWNTVSHEEFRQRHDTHSIGVVCISRHAG